MSHKYTISFLTLGIVVMVQMTACGIKSTACKCGRDFRSITSTECILRQEKWVGDGNFQSNTSAARHTVFAAEVLL